MWSSTFSVAANLLKGTSAPPVTCLPIHIKSPGLPSLPPLSNSSAMRPTETSAKAIFLRMLHKVWARRWLSLYSEPIPFPCVDFYRSIQTFRRTGVYAISIGNYI